MAQRTVEAVQIEATLGLALPETQVVRVLGVIARNHGIVRDCQDLLTTTPEGLHTIQALGVAVEADLV